MVALLNLSSWCLVMVKWLLLAVPWGCLRFVIVVFPDHTHLLFFMHTIINTYYVRIVLIMPNKTRPHTQDYLSIKLQANLFNACYMCLQHNNLSN